MSHEALQKAIDICGSQSELARRIGASPRQVSNWLRRERRAAARYALKIEQAVNGAVTCYELRPDIFPPPVPATDDCEALSTLPP